MAYRLMLASECQVDRPKSLFTPTPVVLHPRSSALQSGTAEVEKVLKYTRLTMITFVHYRNKKLLASLLGARTPLGAPGRTTRSK